ncbi:MAG: DUF1788 domain-containing protein [Anaerolineales bacterium]|nr:DUF1788 domain-containing protein [Anaerolineales bacterium]
MSSLNEKFAELERLLINQRKTLALHSGVPFVLLIYDPNEENLCQEAQSHLKTKLEDAELVIKEIPVEGFIFEHYKGIGLLDKVFEKEVKNPGDVYRDLSKNFRPALALRIIEQSEALEGQDAVLFLTQVSHLYPFVRVSNLLNDLENRVKLPLVIFYPGEELDGELRFLGLENADGPHTKYRARRI